MIILATANRTNGLIAYGSCSFIVDTGLVRGRPISTKKISRRLYTAVKEVAIRVKVMAQMFTYDADIASRMVSLEKKPVMKGTPIKERMLRVKQEEVMGIRYNIPPIFRISCSPFRLWINEPEQRNSNALKKACVQICKNARSGWFKPIATIIKPSWLDVENATIFLMSFCVKAQRALKKVVKAPRHKQMVKIVGLNSMRGFMRTNRKIPATTIVLECSKAETGVGPSIAEGNQGCKLN